MSNDSENVSLLSNKTYDFLKKLVQLILPAIGSLYFGLGEIWNLPASDKVVASTAVLATFFGVLLRLSSKTYTPESDQYDGDVVVTEDGEDGLTFVLELNGDPNDIPEQDSIRFKVVRRQPE